MQTDMSSVIAGRLNDYIRDLETVVNIDSSSDNPAGISQVAQFLSHRLKAIGFGTRLQKMGDRGVPCLQASNKPANKMADIMFLGHMDTVFPVGEAARRPFAIEGNKATGPGVCDMKGGLLVALYTIDILHCFGVLDRLAIRVCLNGDEEVGSAASRAWIEDHARNSQRVFVFEPCRPGHRLVLNRKGGGSFRIMVRGAAAHAGVEPEKGANAAVEIAHQVLAVQRFNQSAPEGVSANATVLRSGQKTNIIPDEASAEVDVRVLLGNQVAEVESFFRSLPDRTHVPGVTVTVNGGVERPPMEADEKTMQLFQVLEAQAEKIGLSIASITTGGCSDGNFSSALGIPTIDGMGPIGANSHRSDEYVDLDSVVPQIELISSVCQVLARLK